MSIQKIDRLEDSTNLEAIRIYIGDTRVLTFTLKDSDNVVVDLSSKAASDFKLTANPEFGGVQIFQVSGAFATDGTDGKLEFTLGPTELAATVEDAIMELVDTSGGVQRTHEQWKFDILNAITA